LSGEIYSRCDSEFDTRGLQSDMIDAYIIFFVQPEFVPHREHRLSYEE